ncbi:MAG: hypothetical protein WA088_05045, partial [Latilactobacillus curvatus]
INNTPLFAIRLFNANLSTCRRGGSECSPHPFTILLFFGSRFLLRKTTINRHKNGLLIGAVCVVCAIAIPLVLAAYYLF